MRPNVFMVGTFPPPIHGMALVNARVCQSVQNLGCTVTVCDISANSLSRGPLARLGRLVRVTRSIGRFVWGALSTRGQSFYTGVSGGYGQLYELVFLFIARMVRLPIFLHHHSFAYLRSTKPLTRLLTFVAGRNATHIVLCDCMAASLRMCYGEQLHVKVISNAATNGAATDGVGFVREGLSTVGYLSNISEEKGIFVFIEIFTAMRRKGLVVNGCIAGPFQDHATRQRVLSQIADVQGLEYVGSKYDAQKVSFFDSIDVLVFPSRYVNEAEPLTIHEAMSRGLPILSFDRGCIREIVPIAAGVVLRDCDTIVDQAVEVLTDWYDSPDSLRSASAHALAAYKNLRDSHQAAFNNLCKIMAGVRDGSEQTVFSK